MGLLSDVSSVCTSSFTGRTRIILSLFPSIVICLAVKHLHNCPKEPMIPIYLLVGGVVCLLLQILPCLYCSESPHCFCYTLYALLLSFCPIWLITGSIFVYRAYEPNYDFRSSDDFCEKIVYRFAFWMTNAIYVAIPVVLLGSCFDWLDEVWKTRARKQSYIKTIS